MATVARRTPVASAAREATRPAKAHSSGYHGAEGMQRMEQEQERQAARKEVAQMNANMPFRFYCPPGEEREIIIVDDKPNFFRYEHNLKNTRTGKWDIFCACINEDANCPVCKAAERPSYFGMFMTCVDLTPYTNKDGEEVPWSKKLLVVKSAQQKKITRLWQREGSLRGAVLLMTRDGEKDASIGNDIELLEFVEEDTLLSYETVYVYTDSAGKEKSKDIIGHEVFDYDELFPAVTEQQLRALVGGRPEPGSRDHDADVRPSRRGGRSSEFDDPPPSRTAARRGRTIDPDDNPERGVEPSEPAPRRAAPLRRGMARQEVLEDEPAPVARRAVGRAAESEPEQESEPPSRRATSRAAPQPAQRTTARAPLRRAVPEPEVEDPPDGDDAPRAASLADRRRQARGR